uniref:tRNA (guanine(26)-N(2))-dimethyltransferase n=1 Tax=Meloidogyne javanica TaxID=6303 RepID=A0A915ME13_MELJA
METECSTEYIKEGLAKIYTDTEAISFYNPIQEFNRDLTDLMNEHRKFSKRFHAIDLDPYGSPSIFLDSAVQSVIDGDTAVLCGNTPEACFNKYGSIPIKHKACHEIALRILLRSIDSHANRYGRYIVPILSVSIDFYVRCFVRVESGASIAKDSVTKLANIFSCSNCQCWSFQPLIKKTTNNSSNNSQENKIKEPICSFCGCKAIHFGGPIYIAPIHDKIFVKKMLESLKKENNFSFGTIKRLVGVLTLVLEELNDQPLFYEFEQLMRIIKCSSTPKNTFVRSALLNAGFKCSGSHCGPQALKTDAPTEFLWDICREWCTNGIVNRPVDFTLHKEAIPASKIENILRFQDNKGKNWGPKSKAKGSISSAKAGFGEEF